MRLAEASGPVTLDLRKSNFCSFKSDLRIFGLVLLVPLVLLVLVFWYFWYFVKLGFHFPGDPAIEKVC